MTSISINCLTKLGLNAAWSSCCASLVHPVLQKSYSIFSFHKCPSPPSCFPPLLEKTSSNRKQVKRCPSHSIYRYPMTPTPPIVLLPAPCHQCLSRKVYSNCVSDSFCYSRTVLEFVSSLTLFLTFSVSLLPAYKYTIISLGFKSPCHLIALAHIPAYFCDNSYPTYHPISSFPFEENSSVSSGCLLPGFQDYTVFWFYFQPSTISQFFQLSPLLFSKQDSILLQVCKSKI